MGKYLSNVNADGRGLVLIAGRFEGGTEDVDSQVGVGFTAAWSSTGTYTLTFDDSYNELVSVTTGLGAATTANVDDYQIVADQDSWTTAGKVLTIFTSEWADEATVGAATDLAADEWVNFQVVFRNTLLTT